MSQNYITKEGLEKLKEELKFLQGIKRKEISAESAELYSLNPSELRILIERS